MIAAIPTLIAGPHFTPKWTSQSPYHRTEFLIGQQFLDKTQRRSLTLITFGRYLCIPFSTLGAYVCFRWARHLFGPMSGLCAALLWCLCPTIAAWSAALTTDVAAAATGITAVHAVYTWLSTRSFRTALFAGITAGIALLTKLVWLILCAVIPILLAITWCRTMRIWPLRRAFLQLLLLAVSACCVLNLGYFFDGTFTRLRDFRFISRALGGPLAHTVPGNRFERTVFADLPVPVPKYFVYGIDVQKHDFERGRWCYLRGLHKWRGWRSFYVYALLVKTPAGTIAAACLAIFLACIHKRYRLRIDGEFALFLPAAIGLIVISTEIGFTRYVRYSIPFLPFMFVSISRIARSFAFRDILYCHLTCLCLCASLVSNLSTLPHCLSYFNEISGGPRRGYMHLLDSNIDGGQDLLFLKSWASSRSDGDPLFVRFYGAIRPEVVGIGCNPIDSLSTVLARRRVLPGWYAISINELHSYRHDIGDESAYTQYSYLRHLEPTAMAGYSICLYHISNADAASLYRIITQHVN
jgi:hypothetical protein